MNIRSVLGRLPLVLAAKNKICAENLKARKFGEMARRNKFDDARELVNCPNPVIVDGGAHKGSAVREFYERFDNPEIYAFEAIPELAAEIVESFSNTQGMTVFQKAIGAKNCKVKFNILERTSASSVLAPTEETFKIHGKGMSTKNVIEVDMVRLDSFLPEGKNVDILKLDLQGYELEALKGAAGILDKVKVIITEVEFIPLYEGQPLFSDLDIYLRERGFRLFNFYHLYTFPSGQMDAGDAIFVRNDIAKNLPL